MTTEPGWTPDQEWEDYKGDDGYHHVRPVWRVKGPAPFGGLRCSDEQQAIEVCDRLNELTGREPVAPEPRAPLEPNPIAVGLGQALTMHGGPGVRATGDGNTLTFSFGAEGSKP